jgi:diguanylate cyclase (GGDEF)-like protein
MTASHQGVTHRSRSGEEPMTLRGRLTVAFIAILVGPTTLGAAALAGVSVWSGTGAASTDESARTAVRTVIESRCRQLTATAAGLATTAAAARQAFAVVPAGATGPWAICGVDPSQGPAVVPTGLAARAEITSGNEATGYAYAVQPLDAAFLAEISAAAGRGVSLAVASDSQPFGQFPDSALASLDLQPDAAVPLRLRLAPAPAGSDRLPVLLIALGVALVASALIAFWLADIAVRPLHRLLVAVDRARAGDLTARTSLDGRDETGRLGRRLDELIAGMQETQLLSVTDPLTGLGNRRRLAEELHLEIERASRFGRSLGVLALDLDHFKAVNDRYGHRAGDAVLIETAARIRSALRGVDMAFRQGGEEFVVLLPETDIAGSLTAAQRVGAAVRDSAFPLVGQSAYETAWVTVSVGVAVFPRHAQNGVDLLDAADQALYGAKAAGRNTVVLASGTGAGTDTTRAVGELAARA